MRNKHLVYAMLGLAVTVSMLACNAQTQTEDLPSITDHNDVMVSTMYGYTLQDCGSSICYRHPNGGMAVMTERQDAWETNTVLETVMFDYVDEWNGDLIYRAVEDDAYHWYVYDIASDTSAPLELPDAYPASDALNDVSGICVIEDHLYIMHSYWQGISCFDLATGAYVTTFDAETWGGFVPCSADETTFYVPSTIGMDVFDLVSGEKTSYDWSANEHWLGSAKLKSAFLTESGRMYLHIAREDAMVPEEQKRGILYADTKGDVSELVPVTSLGDLPAYSVTRVYGEYCGTLVLTDGTQLYAYDTETDKITALCEMHDDNVTCAGGYVLTSSKDGYDVSVIAEIPDTVA